MSTAIDNPRVKARGGLALPTLGLGTWMMGMDPANRTDEVAALRLGMDLGLTLIDTAENYGGRRLGESGWRGYQRPA